MPYIAVEPGIHLFVEDLNNGGKPVVFIHGWPMNYKNYEYQMSFLPQYGFRCIGIDLRGFGKSDHPLEGYTYDRLADDVRVVLDCLDLREVTLVGHSMGGAIAVRYAARHANYRLEKLALLGAAAPVFTKRWDFAYGFTQAEVNALIDKNNRDRPQMLEDFGALFFASKISPSFRAWFHSLGLEASSRATAMCAVALRDEDLRGDLSKIAVPTGIFHGKLDKICPYELGVALHQGICCSELISFDHSGHGVFYDELEKFNALFLQFLNQNGSDLLLG